MPESCIMHMHIYRHPSFNCHICYVGHVFGNVCRSYTYDTRYQVQYSHLRNCQTVLSGQYSYLGKWNCDVIEAFSWERLPPHSCVDRLTAFRPPRVSHRTPIVCHFGIWSQNCVNYNITTAIIWQVGPPPPTTVIPPGGPQSFRES